MAAIDRLEAHLDSEPPPPQSDPVTPWPAVVRLHRTGGGATQSDPLELPT